MIVATNRSFSGDPPRFITSRVTCGGVALSDLRVTAMGTIWDSAKCPDGDSLIAVCAV